MSDTLSIQGYQPLTRMQEKAAQLRQELEAAAKGDRHAQFKRSPAHSVGSGSLTAGGAGGGGGFGSTTSIPTSGTSRRFLRTSTVRSSHSVTALATAGSSSAGGAAGPTISGGGASGALDPGPFAVASRVPSRRASNASGVATDASAEEPRLTTSGTVRSSSPSRRMPRGSRISTVSQMHDYAAAISRQNQLEDKVAELEDRVRELSADNERRQESYMRREAVLQEEVERLEESLRKARGETTGTNPALGKTAANIRELHSNVVSQIEDLLDAQAASFRSEENTTLRRFANRLTELEAAVVAERNKAASREEVDGLERIKKLSRERDDMQEIAQILDKKHSLLSEENSRLRAQFKLQEEDREYLIKQTVALKKENAALRNQLAALTQDVTALTQEKDDLAAALTAAGDADGGGGASAAASGFRVTYGGGGGGSRPASSRGGGFAATAALGNASGPEGQIAIKIQRYEDVIDSLKRLLEAERRRTKQARAAHTLELQQRTELQAVLRQCLEAVRERRRALESESQREADRAATRSRPLTAVRQHPHSPASASASAVSRPLSARLLPNSHRPNSAASASGGAADWPSAPSPSSGGAAGCHPLTPSQREELISTLLVNEQVLRLVFDRAFPGVTPHPPSDPFLERMAAWQEQRDAQVAANAKVLAAAKNAVLPPATAVKEATPGGMLIKEAANRPWVLNVDAMLADFLGGTGGGAGGTGGGAGGGGPPSARSGAGGGGD